MPRRSDDRDLLTTGQVATLLGTTPRHVVNLCLRGELPYTMAGTHRRIRRADALALAERPAANHGGPLTGDQPRSLWLHRAAAGHVAGDPVGTLAQARTRDEDLLAGEPDGARWLRHWLSLIDRGPEAVMRTMTSTDPLARELRQSSPFFGSLPDDERRAILEAFRATGRAVRRSAGRATGRSGAGALENLEGNSMTSTAAPNFVTATYIRATPEAIWRAMTETDFTLRYFYGSAVESDWQPGSAYRMTTDGELQIEGEIVEANAPRRLVQTFHAVWDESVKADASTHVTWEIEDVIPGVCKVTLVHSGLVAGSSTLDQISDGWPFIISGLKTLLETGKGLGEE